MKSESQIMKSYKEGEISKQVLENAVRKVLQKHPAKSDIEIAKIVIEELGMPCDEFVYVMDMLYYILI